MKPVTFGVHLQSRAPADPSHTQMLEDAIRAEQVGLDAVWVPDHYYFQMPWGLETYPEAWTLMTAIAMRTERVRVGSDVIAAGFRHPAMLAKMSGALQELSGGRLILGIGAGNQIHEHTAFDVGFERRIGRFKEYMAIMTGLMNGETISMEGRHFTLREATLRTVVPKMPIWVAAGGEQMMGLVAKYATGCNQAGVGGMPDVFKSKYAALQQIMKDNGRDISELEIGMMFGLVVEADASAARQTAEALADQHKTTVETLTQRMAIGTPDVIAARVRTFTELGLTHVIFAPSLAPRPERFHEQLELLAREVAPLVTK